jgi:putative tryptophan/tyrosine transport system substrate-binding protein
VSTGFAASLAKPGGIVTGMTMQSNDLARKRLQLVREIVPGANRIGVLTLRIPPGAADVNRLPRDSLMIEMEAAGRRMGVEIVSAEAVDAAELPGAFGELRRAHAQAVFVQANPLTLQYQARVAELAAGHRLPALYELRTFAEAGGLVSYGPDLVEMYRRAASFVDRILKGEKPSDLPIEQPEKLELVINSKAAHALGLAIPQAVLLRADEVIR